MSFEEKIKEWVQLDNQIKVYNERIRKIKEQRSEIAQSILGNEDNFETRMCNKSVKISDGTLKFVNTRVTPQLTFKYVESSLSQIIKNEDQVEQILKFLKENREIKFVPEIKRYS